VPVSCVRSSVGKLGTASDFGLNQLVILGRAAGAVDAPIFVDCLFYFLVKLVLVNRHGVTSIRGAIFVVLVWFVGVVGVELVVFGGCGRVGRLLDRLLLGDLLVFGTFGGLERLVYSIPSCKSLSHTFLTTSARR
jgi:hypothetical protein